MSMFLLVTYGVREENDDLRSNQLLKYLLHKTYTQKFPNIFGHHGSRMEQ